MVSRDLKISLGTRASWVRVLYVVPKSTNLEYQWAWLHSRNWGQYRLIPEFSGLVYHIQYSSPWGLSTKWNFYTHMPYRLIPEFSGLGYHIQYLSPWSSSTKMPYRLICRCHIDWYLRLVNLGTTYNTQAHEAWVPSGIFKPPDAMSSCHGGKENKELEFSELEY